MTTSLLNKIFLTVAMLLLLVSCGRRQATSVAGYKKMVQDAESLTKTKTFNNVSYAVTYVPAEIIALRNIEWQGAVVKDTLDRYLEKTRNTLYFTLSISDAEGFSKIRDEIDNKDKYTYDLSYFNQVVEQNIHLMIGDGDSLACAFVHLEPVTSLKPMFKFFVAFHVNNSDYLEKGFTFILNDHLFKNGNIKLFYDKNSINDLPLLKI